MYEHMYVQVLFVQQSMCALHMYAHTSAHINIYVCMCMCCATLDVSRLHATQHPTVEALLKGLSAADPAAALWMLRVSAFRHATALRPDSNKAQVCTVCMWGCGGCGISLSMGRVCAAPLLELLLSVLLR